MPHVDQSGRSTIIYLVGWSVMNQLICCWGGEGRHRCVRPGSAGASAGPGLRGRLCRSRSKPYLRLVGLVAKLIVVSAPVVGRG